MKGRNTFRSSLIQRRRRGLTLVEVTVSIAIVGVMMVAALSTVTSVVTARHVTQNKQIARTLAELLMSEILSKAYSDPETTGYSFGLEADETGTGDRQPFDDVDDYDGWTSDTMEWQDGIIFLARDGWERSVQVDCVSPGDFSWVLPSGWDLGVKRIIVTVTYQDEPYAELYALRGDTEVR